MRRTVVRTRLSDDEIGLLDALAADYGFTRSATIRVLIARALDQAGPPGALTPYPPADDDGWPASPELQLECVRRRLWDLARQGSATAAVALERTLARELPGPTTTTLAAADDDPFAELDQLAEARRRAQQGRDSTGE